MRPILAFAIFLLLCSGATPEPEYAALVPGSFHLAHDASSAFSVEIETSTAKGDRQAVAALAAPVTGEPQAPAPAPGALGIGDDSSVSLNGICRALLTLAHDNDLPVTFFANLIWQESRLHDDAVSSKGAMGIAQFMPKVAAASGLDNPFDPLQALSASARLLHQLRDQFGNLGFVAAAYNAGAKRVTEWLERRRALPRETRSYVIQVTGRSVREWRKTPPDNSVLQFARRLPCLDTPAFARLEQAQSASARFDESQNGPGHPQSSAALPQKTSAVAAAFAGGDPSLPASRQRAQAAARAERAPEGARRRNP